MEWPASQSARLDWAVDGAGIKFTYGRPRMGGIFCQARQLAAAHIQLRTSLW